jgi:hypothetical protein
MEEITTEKNVPRIEGIEIPPNHTPDQEATERQLFRERNSEYRCGNAKDYPGDSEGTRQNGSRPERIRLERPGAQARSEAVMLTGRGDSFCAGMDFSEPPKLDRSAPHHIRAISFIKLASALRNCSGL